MPETILDSCILRNLNDLGGDDPQLFVAQLFEMLLSSAKEQVVEMQRALAARDFKSLSRVAHAMRGSAASVGALEVSKLCALLEGKAREAKSEGVEELIAQLGDSVSRLQSSLVDLGYCKV